MRYPVLCIDPPVPFETWGARPGGIDSRAAAAFYHVMTWSDLNALGPSINAVAADDCAMFLWLCQPLLIETLRMVEAWVGGWQYKTKAFCWVKLRGASTFHVGMGYWTRANTEDVLLFTRGNPKRVMKDVAQIVATDTDAVLADIGRHSQKPEAVQDRIERLCDGPYLELFARRHRPGWTCVGNELDGLDIRESLARLTTDAPLPAIKSSTTQTDMFTKSDEA